MSAKRIDRFEFERVLWQQNVARVAGVDEAGRGPLAGPVVAAAAIFAIVLGAGGVATAGTCRFE